MKTILGLIDEEGNIYEIPLDVYDLLDYNPSKMEPNQVKTFDGAHVIRHVSFRDFLWYVISFNPYDNKSYLLLYDME